MAVKIERPTLIQAAGNQVLRGMLRVETKTTMYEIQAGEAVITTQGEWIRYSSPGPEGAEYIAVCLPAFSPRTVHRDV